MSNKEVVKISNNMTYLNLISPHEEIKMLDKNEGLYMTNTSRVYSAYNNCQIETLNGINSTFKFGEQIFSINDLQEKFFPETQPVWIKQIFTYHNIALRDYIQERLAFYLELSDKFMLYLIENNRKVTFDEALMEFSQYKFNLSDFSRQTVYSLLKPVHYRYTKYDKGSLLGLADSIKYPKQPRIFPKEIILYDVPCTVNNSKLQLLDDFKLDLTDMNENSCYCRKLKCLYLGNINIFKFVKIKPFFQRKGFNQGYDFEIELTGEGCIFR